MATQKQIKANKINSKKGGRPKGKRTLKAIAQEKAIEVLKNKILEEWEPLVKTKIRLALGIYEFRKINGKQEKVYLTRPDGGSIEYLLEMVVGKPKDTVDLQSPQLDDITAMLRRILTP